jgi:pilus assembly protein CpaF
MADPSVSDILVNSYNQIYVERRGRLELTGVVFTDDKHLLRIIDKIVSRVGRRIDESSPMVDARLPDGSRVNAIIPPIASTDRWCHPAVRSHAAENGRPRQRLQIAHSRYGLDAGRPGQVEDQHAYFRRHGFRQDHAAQHPVRIHSGDERIITIEDAAELQLQQPHVIRLETRPPNIEGKGEVNQRALVRNALRMRPDRIVIGEVRGAEAVDMMQAMNTGHEGSLTTIHANNPRDAISRLENMVSMAGFNLPHKVARQQIAAAITVIVQGNRLTDGRRKITSIQEITGMEGEVVTMQEIFAFRQTDVDATGKVTGHFQATGIRPKIRRQAAQFRRQPARLDVRLDPTLRMRMRRECRIF